jgi:hypothetical protein
LVRDLPRLPGGVRGRAGPVPGRFDQIDIEDEAELLDDVEIENFPTLLIARGERVLFFGTITPDAQTLARLIAGAHAGALDPPASPPPILALARRVTARAQFRRG